MVTGLELLRYLSTIQRPRLFYWEKSGKSIAEVDYQTIRNMEVLPVEVKSGTHGGMKSLWMFLREKHLTDTARRVRICLLYALSQL